MSLELFRAADGGNCLRDDSCHRCNVRLSEDDRLTMKLGGVYFARLCPACVNEWTEHVLPIAHAFMEADKT